MPVKMQHYVPRLYLKRFAILGSERIFCYDLMTRKTIETSISNVGGEQFFYDFNAPKQYFEKYLEEAESEIGRAYEAILSKGTARTLSQEEREQMAFFIALQVSRTRRFREFIKGWVDANRYELLGPNPSSRDEELVSNIIKPGKQEFELKGIQKVIISRLVNELTPIVFRMKWIVFKKQMSDVFVTSDHPIALFIPRELPGSTMVGFERVGIQIYLPLNPFLCLCICDPTSYDQPGVIQVRKPEKMDFINGLQIRNANRFVFSSKIDFSIIQRMPVT